MCLGFLPSLASSEIRIIAEAAHHDGAGPWLATQFHCYAIVSVMNNVYYSMCYGSIS